MSASLCRFDFSMVENLLNTGTPSLVEAFLTEFGFRLINPREIERLLLTSSREIRVFGMLSTVIEYTHGADTDRGRALSETLLIYLQRNFHNLKFDDSQMLQGCCASALNSAVYVHFLEGDWNRVHQLIEEAASKLPDLTGQEQYWNAVAITARIFIRRNCIAEAMKLLNGIPIEYQGTHSHYSSIIGELQSFTTKRYEVDQKPLRSDQIISIWERDFPIHLNNLQQLKVFETPRTERIKQLEDMESHLIALHQFARGDIPFSQKYAYVTGEMHRWQEELRRFQSPNGDLDRVNFDWIARCVNEVTKINGIVDHSTSEALELLERLVVAEVWTRETNDIHGYWMILWSRCLLLEILQSPQELLATLRLLCESLNRERRRSIDEETRSDISNFFPELPVKSCKWGDPKVDLELIVDACELRRSRSLVAARADVKKHLVSLTSAGPNALGLRTHYLGFTVMEHENRIQVTLYTSDGTLFSERINIDISTVHEFTTRVDPSEWSKPNFFLKDQCTLQVTLAPSFLHCKMQWKQEKSNVETIFA